MNDGHYTNLRNYLEEIASQNKQILAELKRSNELLEGGATNSKAAAKPATPKAKAPAAAEKQLEAETGKDFTRTGDNPPTFVETDKRGTVATIEDAPAVPRRQDAPVEGLAAMRTMTEPKKGK